MTSRTNYECPTCKGTGGSYEDLEEGRCRFDCRTAKENWTEGYRYAMQGRRAMPIANTEAEEAYREWKRQQESTS